MPISLAGTLKDPYGASLARATIHFRAVKTSTDVLQHADASTTVAANGSYSIALQFGRYDIELQKPGSPSRFPLLRNVLINSDTTSTTLNQLIVDTNGESDLTPDIVIEFRELTAETRGYRDESRANAEQTGEDRAATAADRDQVAAQRAHVDTQTAAVDTDRQAVAELRGEVASDRTAVEQSTDQVATDRQAVAADRQAAQTSAGNAGDSEQAAADSAAEGAGSALEAKHWATNPPDTPVEEGNGQQFSARHWAEVAAQRTVNAVVYQGVWDASAGEYPAPPVGASYWLVSGAPEGVTIDGVEYRNKDQLIWSPGDPGQWSKIDNTDAVSSVNGKRGGVVLGASDVDADATGTAAAAVAQHEQKTTAHTPQQVGADPAGTGQAAVEVLATSLQALGIGVDTLPHIGDLDAPSTSPGRYRFDQQSGSGTYPTGYGVVLVDSHYVPDGEFWSNQTFIGTNGRIYFRQSINGAAWSEWQEIPKLSQVIEKETSSINTGDAFTLFGQATEIHMGPPDANDQRGGPHRILFYGDGDDAGLVDLTIAYRAGPRALQIEDRGERTLLSIDVNGNLTAPNGSVIGAKEIWTGRATGIGTGDAAANYYNGNIGGMTLHMSTQWVSFSGAGWGNSGNAAGDIEVTATHVLSNIQNNGAHYSTLQIQVGDIQYNGCRLCFVDGSGSSGVQVSVQAIRR